MRLLVVWDLMYAFLPLGFPARPPYFPCIFLTFLVSLYLSRPAHSWKRMTFFLCFFPAAAERGLRLRNVPARNVHADEMDANLMLMSGCFGCHCCRRRRRRSGAQPGSPTHTHRNLDSASAQPGPPWPALRLQRNRGRKRGLQFRHGGLKHRSEFSDRFEASASRQPLGAPGGAAGR